MSEKNILNELNNITYLEEEVQKYLVNDSPELSEIYMRKNFIIRTLTEKESREFIEEKLRNTEKILHLMGLENMHAAAAQSAVAVGSGIGALPFLNMQINSILAVTSERLFVILLDGDLKTSTIREYELKDVDYIKTAMDGTAEYLFIKLKNKRQHDFQLFAPGYSYEKMESAVKDTLKQHGVEFKLKSKHLSKQITLGYIALWSFVGIIFIYMMWTWL